MGPSATPRHERSQGSYSMANAVGQDFLSREVAK
jgi:hypothetical protein